MRAEDQARRLADVISERVYRALLTLYPAEHRRDYEEPMVQLFRDRMRRDGGGLRTLAVWVRMVFDLVCSAFEEHRDRPMLESAAVKRAAVRSGEFLLWSLVGAIGLYLVTTLAALIAGLASLRTGWFPPIIETGLLKLVGPTVFIHDRPNTHISFEFDLPGFLVLVVAAGFMTGTALAMRALRMSLKS